MQDNFLKSAYNDEQMKLRLERSMIYVAEVEGELTGFANYSPVREVYINVEKDNTIGMNFYKAKGFEIVEEFDDDFDGHILKTVRMVMKVN